MNSIGKLPGLIKKSLTLRGHRTSVALEQEFWTAFEDIARRENYSVRDLVTAVDETRDDGVSLASSIRVYVLTQYRNADPRHGHSGAEA
ncbi:MAG: ribbon-helix-helix domain-containing protein [Albidovulum sp.]|nr:ribbon-helix-helix domain-containing protein [Albidovulum sp.]MDE0531252.1 ribbon-helix-helix domain-containing protein [Albidovulum sp.]